MNHMLRSKLVLDKSIVELSKRKLKLLKEVNDINETISFLRKQQEQLTNV